MNLAFILKVLGIKITLEQAAATVQNNSTTPRGASPIVVACSDGNGTRPRSDHLLGAVPSGWEQLHNRLGLSTLRCGLVPVVHSNPVGSWLDGPPSVYRLLVISRTYLRRLKDSRADIERIEDAEAVVAVLEKVAFS